jgi:hypothetical protein
MDADTPRYTLRQVAIATGWHLGTMRDYHVRGIFPWAGDDGKAAVAGATSRMSLRGAIRLGLAFDLWTQGVAPREAFKAATAFADFGSVPTRNSFGITRLAGSIFPDGYATILVWRAGDGARVVPVKNGGATPMSALLSAPFDGKTGPVVIAPVDDVVARVMKALAVPEQCDGGGGMDQSMTPDNERAG